MYMLSSSAFNIRFPVIYSLALQQLSANEQSDDKLLFLLFSRSCWFWMVMGWVNGRFWFVWLYSWISDSVRSQVEKANVYMK